MRSAARCTYTEVAEVLAGQRLPHRERFREGFGRMAELQALLSAMRARRGAIDFDLPESKIVLGDDGGVAAIERRPRNRAHRIVEELMLAANEAVARNFGERELHTVYRIHGLPDEEKLDAFRKLARLHGFAVPDGPLGPRELNRLLHGFEGHAQQRALNQLLLRAMMQAVYSAENQGHFGLAAEHYLHVTSPIRRLPDLMVHRLLKEEWVRRAGRPAPRAASAEVLQEVAVRASERERAAMEAEREIAGFYAALFMKDKVGERFPGTVAAVAEPGLFVELTPFFVEGLVRAEELPGAFELDPVHHAMVDRGTGRAFRVGDAVEVQVMAASTERRRIELALTTAVPAGEPGLRGEVRPLRRTLKAALRTSHRMDEARPGMVARAGSPGMGGSGGLGMGGGPGRSGGKGGGQGKKGGGGRGRRGR
jgi:ribonuclease R